MLALMMTLALSADTFGRVVLAMGTVTAKQGDATRTLKAGDTVYRGERVATDTEGRTKLLLEDRSVVSLGPKSELELLDVTTPAAPTVPKTTVKLFFGRLWANVQKALGGEAKFDVQTPNAVAGVRGTSFFADSGEKGTVFSVANGTVFVTSGNNSQLLAALQQITASGGGLGGVVNLPPGAVQELINSLSSGGGLSEADRLSRLEQLQNQLNPPNQGGNDFGGNNTNPGTPPINIDPAQTTQTTIIRGRVEVVQP